jgi:ABC-2 type transport system permease protein
VLIGQVLGQMFETTIGVVVTIAVGLIVGWTPSMGAGDVVQALVILLAFMLASTAMGVLVGLTFKSADAAQGIGFIVVMPLSFMSGTFVPTSGMPKVMEVIGEWNPVAPLVAAVRELTGSVAASGPWPLEHPVTATLIWTVVLLAVAVPLGLRRFRFATTN